MGCSVRRQGERRGKGREDIKKETYNSFLASNPLLHGFLYVVS